MSLQPHVQIRPRAFALIGHPVHHSLSAFMHEAAFRELGLPHTYQCIDVAPGDLEMWVKSSRTRLDGFNITIPHKEAIIPYLDQVTAEAQTMGAVNTVVVQNGTMTGSNTDVTGIVESLRPYQQELRGKHAVVLGAGGAARAVVYGLTQVLGLRSVDIASRTLSRAERLTESMQLPADSVRCLSPEIPALRSSIEQCCLLVNATPVGMHPHPEANPLPPGVVIPPHVIVFDLVYRPLNTVFLEFANQSECRTIGGLEMLIHQGAQAFELWTGQTMPLGAVRNVLLKQLSAA